MVAKTFIAQRKLIGIDPGGNRRTIHIQIGLPYEYGPEEWVCPVGLEGLYPELSDTHGGDSFQALVLAIRLTRKLLEGYIKKGGVLVDEYEGENVNLEDAFSSGVF